MDGLLNIAGTYYAAGQANKAAKASTAAQKKAADYSKDFWSDPSNTAGMLTYAAQSAKKLGQIDLDFAQKQGLMNLGLYQDTNAAQIGGNSQLRGANLGDLSAYGGAYQDQILANSPTMQNGLGWLTNGISTAGQQDAISQELNTQALDNLRLGTSLSPDQLREVTQGTRQGYADRGMVNSNPALGAELMSRMNYGLQLQNQRQNQALGVENQNEQRLGNARNFVSNATSVGQNSLAPMLGFMGQTATPVTSTAALTSGSNAGQYGASAVSNANNYLGMMNGMNTNYANSVGDTARTRANGNSAIMGSVMNAADGGWLTNSSSGGSSSGGGNSGGLLSSLIGLIL